MHKATFEAFFLPVEGEPGGQRFCIFHPAQGGTVRGAVLYIHPFAEEMNKSRRMAALQSRALAQAGFSVLQIDLRGCGDSSGDFGDASWQDWVEDVVRGCGWLRERVASAGIGQPGPSWWLWGLRAGCLVIAEAAKQLPENWNFVFWQAPASGKPLLQQFLRLKVAGDLIRGGGKGVMEGLRRQLANGEPVEVAGYTLAAPLAQGLERTVLAPPAVHGPTTPPRLEWFELSTREDASLSPVSATTVNQWKQVGYDAQEHIVNGPAFWQTTEIEDAPALVAATTSALLA
jgi:exosortase A-associated hydrolase 2